jgi:hypothetical protein
MSYTKVAAYYFSRMWFLEECNMSCEGNQSTCDIFESHKHTCALQTKHGFLPSHSHSTTVHLVHRLLTTCSHSTTQIIAPLQVAKKSLLLPLTFKLTLHWEYVWVTKRLWPQVTFGLYFYVSLSLSLLKINKQARYVKKLKKKHQPRAN